MNISARIKELRKERKITQSQLAIESNISLDMIKSIESGRANPGIETLTKLSDIFKVSTDYLLGKTNSPDKTVDLLIEEFTENIPLDLKEEILKYPNVEKAIIEMLSCIDFSDLDFSNLTEGPYENGWTKEEIINVFKSRLFVESLPLIPIEPKLEFIKQIQKEEYNEVWIHNLEINNRKNTIKELVNSDRDLSWEEKDELAKELLLFYNKKKEEITLKRNK